MLFVIAGVIWLSFKPVLAHASCVSSTLLASVRSVKTGVIFQDGVRLPAIPVGKLFTLCVTVVQQYNMILAER